jgi:hypothetical protein
MIGIALEIFRQSHAKDYSQDRHKDVIKKLKFISRIEAGERINVNTVSTSSNSIFNSIYRSVFKESRTKTFSFLNEVIDRSFELIVLYKGSHKISDQITCSQIIEDITMSIHGLENLQSTYSEDRNFICDIDTLIGSIFARLIELYESNMYLPPKAKEKIMKILPRKEDMSLTESNSMSKVTELSSKVNSMSKSLALTTSSSPVYHSELD